MTFRAQLQRALSDEGSAAVVTLTQTQGSTPRERGAWMIVRPSGGFHGTVGGGALEWSLLQQAQARLSAREAGTFEFTHVLGPDLGQCCGGRVRGKVTVVTVDSMGGNVDQIDLRACDENVVEEIPTPLYLFGAGHVGRALTLALANLPFAIRWIDERADIFPAAMPQNTKPVCAPAPAAELATAAPGTFVLVMTHSHALDLDLVSVALGDKRFPYVGLIGSDTKRARFVGRLRDFGLGDDAVSRLVCPIGISGLTGKEPAIIAASVAAQLLLRRAELYTGEAA